LKRYPLARVALERVRLDCEVVRCQCHDAGPITGRRAPLDADVVGAPQEDPGKANVDDRDLLDLNRAGVLHVDADVTVVRQREPAQVVVACAH
jgi:hypothetical protein